MKEDKKKLAPNISLITERFNDTCRLIVSEIVSSPSLTVRVERIEKWTAVADICRCLHNYNGVLQVIIILVLSLSSVVLPLPSLSLYLHGASPGVRRLYELLCVPPEEDLGEDWQDDEGNNRQVAGDCEQRWETSEPEGRLAQM